MTTPKATNTATSKRPAPKVRDDLPAPQTAEGLLFHYTPAEAARWTPFSYRTLIDKIARREIDYVFNGRDNYLTGAQIVALTERFTVRPFQKQPARAAA